MDSLQLEGKVLGTAGHIDHGKSSLVKALTGIDPDKLLEEKRRGITIELGFAQLNLPDGTRVGLVDVPGHERFVRQMIAGSSGIDIALLCIAADDGIMPQTIEHLAVLSLLSVPNCVVALTKADLVDDEWLSFVRSEIHSYLKTSAYPKAAIIPVSSKTGLGIEELRQELAKAFGQSKRAKFGDSSRLPVDRVFSIKGSGTVITGTLWSGSIIVGDELEVLPSGKIARVRNIHKHNESIDKALKGNRVALNLHGLKTDEIRPGDFLAHPNTIITSKCFDASFSYVDTGQKKKPLKQGSRIHVAHGTKEVIGRIFFLGNREALMFNESCFAQIRLEEPLPVSGKDRFIARSYSPVHVLGGGIVLQSHPKKRLKISDVEQNLLEALGANDQEAACRAAVDLHEEPLSACILSRMLDINEDGLEGILKQLCQEKVLQKIGCGTSLFYFKPKLLAKYLGILNNLLLRFHAENPSEPGIAKIALQKLCFPSMKTEVFEILLAAGEKSHILAMHNGNVVHPKANAGIKLIEEKAAEKLLSLLTQNTLAPPAVLSLIEQSGLEPSLAHRALGSLEKNGLIRRVGTELYFEVKTLEALELCVLNYLSSYGCATASELKDTMGTSRKYAIPLLEYFDKLGLTKRDGDMRKLGPKHSKIKK